MPCLPSGIAWGKYFTDGSGGKFSSLPCLRRCGVGIAFLGFPAFVPKMLFGFSSNLLRENQTMPMAELLGVTIVVCQVLPDSALEVVSDSDECVVKVGKRRFLDHTATEQHADHWNVVLRAVSCKNLGVTFAWTKGHVKAEDLFKYNVGLTNTFGNNVADLLAVRGAKKAQVDQQTASSTLDAIRAVVLIQRRAVAIISFASQGGSRKKYPGKHSGDKADAPGQTR